MKQYILLLLVCLIFLPMASFALENWNNTDSQIPNNGADNNQQTYFYYYKGNKKYLKLNPNYIFVSGTDANSIQKANLNTHIQVKKTSDVKEDITSQTLRKPNNLKKKHPVRYWAEVELTKKYSAEDYFDRIETLKSNANLIVAPYFESKTGDKIGLSNYFYVKLKESTDLKVLQEQIEKHNVELVGNNKFMPLWFTLSVTPQSPNALQMANIFYETGLFQHAEPDLMADIQFNNTESSPENTFTSLDPYYSDQWHLKNTGQNGGTLGIDIKAEAAWGITTGNNNIKVAVVDQGFEMNHPDLDDNTVGTGYNTATGSSPSVVHGRHGTPCAGLISAKGNNNEGVSGVAPNGGLISVSLLLDGINNSQVLADGISWAWQNGADVISNSWATVPNSMVDNAITNALADGRNGKGAVVVFAAGNSNSNVVYPANSNPDILAVGAMSPCGERKSLSSCDGLQSLGSSYGSQLDIVAPGVFISTTDRQGSNGYNGYSNLDYTNDFGATSAACPIVAGVAALVLSVDPTLTVQEVNNIIEESARKVSSNLYNYQTTAGRPNGTWNNEMGYGLVDAYQAVLLSGGSNDDDQVNLKSTACATPIVNGDEVTIQYEIMNTGSTNSGSFFTGWYLRGIDSPNTSPFAVLALHPGLNAGTSEVLEVVFDLDYEMETANLSAGNYELSMKIDISNEVAESNEDDNECIGSTTLSYNTTATNLTYTNQCLTTEIVGDYLNVYYDITNTGNADAGSFTISWQVIENGSIIPILFGDENQIAGLPANTTESFTRSFDLPQAMNEANLAPGTYNLLFQIDSYDNISESSETDNICFSSSPFNYSDSCDPDGDFQGTYNGTLNYAAPNYINAPASGNQCIILSGSNVTLQAGNYITLNPGFTAEYGSKFHAFIDDCDDVENKVEVEQAPVTLRNYPNPFTGQTNIEFVLPQDSPVTLFVSDMTGRKVTILLDNKQQTEGTHLFTFDGSNYPAGMYYYTIQAGEYIGTQKMILVK